MGLLITAAGIAVFGILGMLMVHFTKDEDAKQDDQPPR